MVSTPLRRPTLRDEALRAGSAWVKTNFLLFPLIVLPQATPCNECPSIACTSMSTRTVSVPHDGKNLFLRRPFCFHCQRDRTIQSFSNSTSRCSHGSGGNPKKLKTCSGCKVAYYCSVECQKADRKEHASSFCKAVTAQRKRVESTKGPYLGVCKKLAEGHSGLVYFDPNVAFMTTRLDLAIMHLHGLASEFHGKWIWDEVLSLLQEFLRLSHLLDGYDFGSKRKFALFLLNVDDRDEDAYSYIHYRLTMEGKELSSNAENVAFDFLSLKTSPGAWIYPPLQFAENGSKKEYFLFDVLNEVMPLYNDHVQEMDNCYLMALWILKKKAASTIAGREEAYVNFQQSYVNSDLCARVPVRPEVLLQVKDFLMGGYDDCKRQMEELNRQLDQISDLLDQSIPCLLPAFLSDNPLEYLKQRWSRESGLPVEQWTMDLESEDEFFGQPQEAYIIIMDSGYAVAGLPDIKPWLMQRYNR